MDYSSLIEKHPQYRLHYARRAAIDEAYLKKKLAKQQTQLDCVNHVITREEEYFLNVQIDKQYEMDIEAAYDQFKRDQKIVNDEYRSRHPSDSQIVLQQIEEKIEERDKRLQQIEEKIEERDKRLQQTEEEIKQIFLQTEKYIKLFEKQYQEFFQQSDSQSQIELQQAEEQLNVDLRQVVKQFEAGSESAGEQFEASLRQFQKVLTKVKNRQRLEAAYHNNNETLEKITIETARQNLESLWKFNPRTSKQRITSSRKNLNFKKISGCLIWVKKEVHLYRSGE